MEYDSVENTVRTLNILVLSEFAFLLLSFADQSGNESDKGNKQNEE